MNIRGEVNGPWRSGPALEQALASKLKELLASISWLHDWRVEDISGKADTRFDFSARLPVPGGDVTLYVECKSEMRPSAFHALAAALPLDFGHTNVPVLAMPFVSARLADLCIQYGWNWYDLAGNCHIDVPGAIYIERRGEAPVHRPPRPRANLGTPEAGRVIRALLAPENAGKRWTQRDMEAHFGELRIRIPKPSLGLVNKVVQHLRDEAFIEVSGDGGFRLRDPLKLLFAWRDAYRFDRQERRGYFSLLRGQRLQDALYKLELEAGGFAAYAVFSAADVQAPHVRQAKTWIYVGQDYFPRFKALTEAKAVDTGENLVLLIPDDDGVFYMREGGYVGDMRLACTNAVQTYVDLSHSGGRGKEAAEALLEQRLKPEWNRSGLL